MGLGSQTNLSPEHDQKPSLDLVHFRAKWAYVDTFNVDTMAATTAMARTPPGLVYVIGRALYVSLTNRCNSVSLPATRGKVRSGRGGRI